MPWITKTPMSQRHEFVLLAGQAGTNFRQLCRRFGISPKTGYKWRKRFAAQGAAGLTDRSRRPLHSPKRCLEATAAKVLAERAAHPTWGGRKLRRRLQDLQVPGVPSASTCTEILRRAQQLCPRCTVRPFQRFERSCPNQLWQMDFKGHFPTQSGQRCHPLTVLDDCSRFNVLLSPEADETGRTVEAALTRAFSQYGLPDAMLCDNGSPWGHADPTCPYTQLTVWLLRLGVRVLHGRPYHPQTQGKDERFHRTLQTDLIERHTWRDLGHCRELFPGFRDIYNIERPHDSLQGDTPLSRYQPSPRPLPAALPPLEYPAGTRVHVLPANGRFMFGHQTWYVGKAFGGLPIGLRPSAQADGQWEVFFSFHRLGSLDLRSPTQSKHALRSIYSDSF